MHDYRRKRPSLVAAPEKGKPHTIDSLAAQFGIADMGLRLPSPRSETVATSDEEYSTYVNGDLWEQDSDPLRFWEVRLLTKSYMICLYS